MSLIDIHRRNDYLRKIGQLPGALPSSGRETEQPTPIRSLPVLRTQCKHEGAILEPCNQCGARGEARHVRDCDIHDKCTRGFVNNFMHWCGRCPDYTPLGESSKQLPLVEPTVNTSTLSTIPPEPTTYHIPPEVVQVAEEPQRRRRIESGKASVTWAYGVTTVPSRRDDLLPKTLQSLSRAGFDKPRLFVDGDSDTESWRREFDLEVTCRYPNIRTYGNWTLSLAELYFRQPRHTYYAIFQDDFITYRNLRQYLERIRYPDKGYLNLYTFPRNQVLAPNGGRTIGFYKSNQKGLGAVALVFSEEAVVNLLCHQHMILRPRDLVRGSRAVDGGIVTALRKAGWYEYVHNPSLVQHTGTVSSMRNHKHPQATSFRGENYDAMELLDSSSQR